MVNFNNLEALKAIIASTQHENDSISKTSLALLKSLDPKLVIPTLIHMQTKNEIEFRKDRPKFNQLVDTFSPDEIKSYLI